MDKRNQPTDENNETSQDRANLLQLSGEILADSLQNDYFPRRVQCARRAAPQTAGHGTRIKSTKFATITQKSFDEKRQLATQSAAGIRSRTRANQLVNENDKDEYGNLLTVNP